MNKTDFACGLTTCGPGWNTTDKAASIDLEMQAAHVALNYARLLCMRVIAPPVIVLGTLANLLNIVILTRRGMRSSTNSYLTAVAICDTAFLLNFQLLTFKVYPGFNSNGPYMHLFPYLMGTGGLFSNTATWLTCAFTLERYVAVCHPMYGRKVCTREKAVIIIIIVFVLAFILSAPPFFNRRVVTEYASNCTFDNTSSVAPTECTEVVRYKIDYTDFNAYWSRWGLEYISASIFILIPLVILIIFNALLIRSIVVASRVRRQMLAGGGGGGLASSSGCNGGIVRDKRQRNQVEQQKTTRMLIIVVVFFCILQLPAAASIIVHSLHVSDQLTLSHVGQIYFTVYGNVVNILLLLNATLNFVLYSCFSLKFRKTFRRVFLRSCIRNDAESRYTMISATEGGAILPMTPRKQTMAVQKTLRSGRCNNNNEQTSLNSRSSVLQDVVCGGGGGNGTGHPPTRIKWQQVTSM